MFLSQLLFISYIMGLDKSGGHPDFSLLDIIILTWNMLLC